MVGVATPVTWHALKPTRLRWFFAGHYWQPICVLHLLVLLVWPCWATVCQINHGSVVEVLQMAAKWLGKQLQNRWLWYRHVIAKQMLRLLHKWLPKLRCSAHCLHQYLRFMWSAMRHASLAGSATQTGRYPGQLQSTVCHFLRKKMAARRHWPWFQCAEGTMLVSEHRLSIVTRFYLHWQECWKVHVLTEDFSQI